MRSLPVEPATMATAVTRTAPRRTVKSTSTGAVPSARMSSRMITVSLNAMSVPKMPFARRLSPNRAGVESMAVTVPAYPTGFP